MGAEARLVEQLDLPPGPQAVRTARDWVRGQLRVLGRTDLADSASLAVSELVTNALIHGEPPIAVRVLGNGSGPRIEVVDHSGISPRPEPAMTPGPDRLLSTVGRGLSLVGLHSHRWGAEVVGTASKVVWFEPRPEPEELAEPLSLFVIDEEPTREATTVIELRDLPLVAFTRVRNHYLELRRELTLITLDDTPTTEGHALERRLAEVMAQIDQVRAHGSLADMLRSALAAGGPVATLNLEVPTAGLGLVDKFRVLLDQAAPLLPWDDLLTSVPDADDIKLLWWYLQEFVRQSAGAEPIPAPQPS